MTRSKSTQLIDVSDAVGAVVDVIAYGAWFGVLPDLLLPVGYACSGGR